MSRMTDIETAIVNTLSADGSIDALTTTFDEFTGGKDFSFTWESIALTYGQGDRPAIVVKVNRPAEPERFTTNEELYIYPAEIYVIGKMNTSKSAAFNNCNAIVTLIEPIISKQKSATYNFGHDAYSTGCQTEFMEINETNNYICMAIIQTNIIKIHTF